MGKTFKTATAFRKSLESRLMNISQETNIDLQRLRRKVAFDHLLARFFINDRNKWVLKGGYALEIRFAHVRATKDIDLTLPMQLYASSKSEHLMIILQEESHIDLGDYFTLTFRPAMQELDGAFEGGFRFPVEAIMDGRPFVTRAGPALGIVKNNGRKKVGRLEGFRTFDWENLRKRPIFTSKALPRDVVVL